jgi:hypothetical protein
MQKGRARFRLLDSLLKGARIPQSHGVRMPAGAGCYVYWQSAHCLSPACWQPGVRRAVPPEAVTGSHVGSHWDERLLTPSERVRTNGWRSCQLTDRSGQR